MDGAVLISSREAAERGSSALWGRRFDLLFLCAFCAVPLGPAARYAFFAAALTAFVKGGVWRQVAQSWGLVPRYFRLGIWLLLLFGLISEMASFPGIEEAFKGYSMVLEAFVGGLMGFGFFLRRGNFRRWSLSLPWVALFTLAGSVFWSPGYLPIREIGGALSHKGMWYGGALGVVLSSLALYGFCALRGVGRSWLWGAVFVVGVLLVASARSSGAMAGFAVGCGAVGGVLALSCRKDKKPLMRLLGVVVLALAVVGGVLVVSPEIRSYVDRELSQVASLGDSLKSGNFDRFTTYRNIIWAMGVDLFRQRPLLGWGWGRLEEQAPLVSDASLRGRWTSLTSEWPSHFHNDFMELLVSMGVLGGVAYLLLALGFLRMSLWCALRYGLRHPAAGLLGSMAGALVIGMSAGVLPERSVSGMFYWTLWGAVLGVYCRGKGPLGSMDVEGKGFGD
ncbi:MAG: O-antigen ligase family protein [Thermanaerothrix sp.]|nr:O-antigen ligase family protein [Thermanaerothrix sp.]